MLTKRLPASLITLSKTQMRSLSTIKTVKYNAKATSTGGGRDGDVMLDDGSQKFKMALPKELGGKGDGVNPEQLFAMGYAACFLGALQAVARQEKVKLGSNVTISTSVNLGESEGKPGFALAVDISAKGVEDQSLVEKAHKFCPYSRALTEGIKVTVKAE